MEILRTVEQAEDKLDKVKINNQAIEEFTSRIVESDLQVSEISLSHYSWNKEQLLGLVFVFNSINFSYWAEQEQPKWTMTFGGEKLDGAIALFRAFEEELKINPNFTNCSYLKDVKASDLSRILKGNVQIPMFEERIKILNEVGQVLNSKYNGSFINLFESCGNDSTILMSEIISNFPSFFDEESYKGISIPFYKRAQLNSKMISDALISLGEKPLASLEALTAFADYKIPQILRSFGIIEYTPDLSRRIDNQELIEKGSSEEVEIRIATILSVEKMRHQLLNRFNWVTSSHVDSMLWNRSQDKSLEVKPYHRTYTTAY